MTARSSDPLSRGLTFWQNTVSIHQAALMRSLAERAPGPVTVITEDGVSSERQALGWASPDYGGADLVAAPSDGERRRLEHALGRAGVHIFSGLGAYAQTSESMRRVLATEDATIGLFLEPWDPDGWRGRARAVKYRHAARRVRDRVSIVLTTGALGRRQYASAGFSHDAITDFGYFVAYQAALPPKDAEVRQGVRISFIGSLSDRKRVDHLLSALADLPHRNWVLDVVGDGPERPWLTDMADALGLSDLVRWHGVLANDAARLVIAGADVLALPSRFDGWGVVVNEALLAGTRVVVADRCGSSALAQAAGGSVFFSGDERALFRSLQEMLALGPVGLDERAARQEWARTSISPDVAADYLLASLRHRMDGALPPAPPWAVPSQTMW
jgi:glycosyltransferase involved in cell wall biosynthesis